MNTTFAPTITVGSRVNVVWANLALAALIVISAIVHSYNMFGYPLYLGDEGIYMSQAYAVLRLGSVTPYAYWYDHAPVGWLLIAAWTLLTGGFHTFGTAIDGGRVLMLLLHVVSVALVFRITLRITQSAAAALGAGLLFTLSPLSVMYGRMVLLDNIMTFWVLLALALLLRNNGKIWQMLNSGLCFGLAVLTKESAFILLPAFVYGVWALSNPNHARFARAGWMFMAISTISLYFLYAGLRKELIDLSLAPSPLAGGEGSITLIGAILWQLGRSGGAPWDLSSDFYRLFTSDWLVRDALLLALGAVGTIWNLFRGDHRHRLIGLLSLLAIVGLARGGTVLNFYILPLLPLLAMSAALAVEDIARRLRAPVLVPAVLAVAVAFTGFHLSRQADLFTLNLTSIQRQALSWAREHIPPQAQIVTDDDLWVDLRDGGNSQPSFPGAHSHWKVANDPAVYKGLFDNNWRKLDYMILTPGLDTIFARDVGKLTNQAYQNSTPVARFELGNAAVEIRKVDHPGIAVKETVAHTYRSFRDRFIHDGQVRAAGGYTDARDQAGAMLMAVWMDDRATFDRLWQWASVYLRGEKGLLNATNEPGAPAMTFTEADTDAAYALLLAERRWGNAGYGRDARDLLAAIWNHNVVEIDGAPYLAAGDWAVSEERIIFAPATFTPYAYHLFAEADPEHNWWHLLSHNYQQLSFVSGAQLGESQSSGLPPAYVGIDRKSGAFLPNPEGVPSGKGSLFDDYAAQVYWRVGLDAYFHSDQRADRFLSSSRLLRNDWSSRGALAASYSRTGKPEAGQESLMMYSGALAKFLVEDPASAHEVYAKKLATTFTQKDNEGQWGDGSDITQQRWAWLATALYAETLQYEWNVKK